MTTAAAWVSPAEYYASRPKAMVGAGAVYYTADGRFLLVKTSYDSQLWELLGGGMEAGEFPLAIATREIKEEAGLDRPLGRLVVVDVVPPQADGRPQLINFLFDGGEISDQWAEDNIALDEDEVVEWRLVTRAEWAELLPEHMARRLDVCADLIASGSQETAYLQHGYLPDTDTR